MAITPACMLAVITGRTHDDVEEAMESDGAKMYGLTASDQVWARHGAAHPLGAGFTGLQDILPQTIDEQTALSYIAKVPRSLRNEIFVWGTPDEVVEKLAGWRDHGMRHVVLANSSGVQRSLRKGIIATGPFIKILRRLRKL
jgi:phthiodiolone/phenolphthiodiolone dimycocerosates ketoreductase